MKIADWTYVPAKITAARTELISQELVNYWTYLTRDKTINVSRFLFAVPDQAFHECCPVLKETLDELELFEHLDGLGFFVVPPKQPTAIHIDLGYNTVLNFPVLNCDDSYTVWYRDPVEMVEDNPYHISTDTVLNKTEDSEISQHFAGAYKNIPYFFTDASKEFARVEANQALWVNGNIPHRPEVLHDRFRVLATLRFVEIPDSVAIKNIGFIPDVPE
jgi:hypothetical protein